MGRSGSGAETTRWGILADLLARNGCGGTHEQFRTRYSTNFAVIQQQSYLAEAETTEIMAQAAWKKSGIQLERALGKTLKQHGITIKDALPGPKN